jgi:hypothetical protein
MNRFPLEPWENRPSDDEMDRRDSALEDKAKIEAEARRVQADKPEAQSELSATPCSPDGKAVRHYIKCVGSFIDEYGNPQSIEKEYELL